jgi:hypothetical protein
MACTASVAGHVAVSPIAGTALTGFSMTLDSSGKYYTSDQVSGKLYSASNASPTPATLTTAVNDLTTAYNDAAGRANPDFFNLGGGKSIKQSQSNLH